MINAKDVIRMKIPYPSINSRLAVAAHMYICKENKNHRYEYIKCQTLKPSMLLGNQMRHYCDENADISRNPFQRATRIDCDKLFITENVEYADGLKTTSRPDICDELYNDILDELHKDGYSNINIDENTLKNLNPLITPI